MKLRFFTDLDLGNTFVRLYRAQIAYCRHLLKQESTIRKRELIRYFALNFFHDSEVCDWSYLPKRRSITVVLCSNQAESYARYILDESKNDEIDRDHFRYEVTFKDVEWLNIHSDYRSLPLVSYRFGEIRDAQSKRLPKGYTVLRAEFLWDSELEIAFRNVAIRPMFPDRIAKYIPKSKRPIPGLLSGRDVKAALRERIQECQAFLRRTRS